MDAGRGLSEVAAYDPSVEERYVSAILTFREGPSAETPKVSRLQPAYEQLLLPIHRKDDNAVIRETSLSDSLNVVHERVQKVKEGALSHRLSISDSMGPLADPLSSKNLVGEASTSGVPVTAATTTALSVSITIADASSVLPISVACYEVLDAKPQLEASHSPKVFLKRNTWKLHRITLRPVEPAVVAVLPTC
ncbi:hypothetical protein Tco_1086254 [Tanacetum coccineum]